jgi:hypothetical protein
MVPVIQHSFSMEYSVEQFEKCVDHCFSSLLERLDRNVIQA